MTLRICESALNIYGKDQNQKTLKLRELNQGADSFVNNRLPFFTASESTTINMSAVRNVLTFYYCQTETIRFVIYI